MKRQGGGFQRIILESAAFFVREDKRGTVSFPGCRFFDTTAGEWIDVPV